MAYVDLNTIHNPATGTVPPAAWGDQVRDNLEFLVDPPACSVFETGGGQSVPDATATAITFSQENFDNNAMHSTVTNTSRITIQTAGRYLFTATLSFAADSTNARQIEFRVNNATSYGSTRVGASGSGQTVLSGTKTLVLAVGDYVEARAFQNSGSSLNVLGAEFTATWFTR